ncbi:MAG: ABC-F family ATP-binding cassette domain-containing protein [Herpetosiphon sp.]
MAVVSGFQLTKYYGADRIFENVQFMVNRGDKVALVGVNGAGKSTLVKLISGMEEPSAGTVSIARGTRISYLAQEVPFEGPQTLLEAAQEAFAHLKEVEAEMRTLETLLGETDAPAWQERMERYGDLQAHFEHAGGYETEQQIERTLQGLGFAPSQWEQAVGTFSGGQKTRAALAVALLQDPDLLLLDEPTNHLDLQAVQWLENFLQTWPGTLIVISHDRYFLDRVTTRTWDMEWGRLEDYPGGYSKFMQLKVERLTLLQKRYAAQQEFIAKTEDFIRRFKSGQRAKEAQGRLKRLNRFRYGSQTIHGWTKESIDEPRGHKQLRIKLETQLRSGELALVLSDGLTVGFQGPEGQRALIKTPPLELRRGQRVALLGPNGTGKTTLLKTLTGELRALHGHATLGVGIKMGYYAQVHEQLIGTNTVLEEVHRLHPLLKTEQIRSLLGRLLFSNDDVYKLVGDLSGGERSRVALARLILEGSNLLLLDEPTNHLDIASREALEDVLGDFGGTILFVSHDRYFVDALADTLWVVQDGVVDEWEGNYASYIASLDGRRREEPRPVVEAAGSSQPVKGAVNGSQPVKGQASDGQSQKGQSQGKGTDKAQRDKQRRLTAIEREVQEMEVRKQTLEQALGRASATQNVADVTRLGAEYAQLESDLLAKYDDWTMAASEAG